MGLWRLKMNWYVYILQCSDNTLYTGMTDNIEKRVATHNSRKGAKYTRGRLPVSLVYYEELKTRSLALKREAEIKKLSRKNKLILLKSVIFEEYINGDTLN